MSGIPEDSLKPPRLGPKALLNWWSLGPQDLGRLGVEIGGPKNEQQNGP